MPSPSATGATPCRFFCTCVRSNCFYLISLLLRGFEDLKRGFTRAECGTIKPTVQDQCLTPATAPLVFPLAVEILSVAVEILSVAVPPPLLFHPDSKSTLLGP